MIDAEALLAHIKEKAEHSNLLIYAVLTGLATAIERGDFDKKGLKPMDRSEDWSAATEWRDAVLAAWERTAPSYVRADVRPLDAHLHDLWQAGATPEQIAEAFESAFASSEVTKRRAINLAYSRVWAQLAAQAEEER